MFLKEIDFKILRSAEWPNENVIATLGNNNLAPLSGRFLMTAIAIRNLAVGLPPVEQLRSEVAFANMKEPEAEAEPDETLKQEVGHAEL